jgi:hypothetical protein
MIELNFSRLKQTTHYNCNSWMSILLLRSKSCTNWLLHSGPLFRNSNSMAAAAGDSSPVTSLSPSPVPPAISLCDALIVLSQGIDQLATLPSSSGNLRSPKPSPPPTQLLDSGDTTTSEDAASAVSDVLDASIEVVLRHFHRCCYRSSPLWFFCWRGF